MHIFNTTKRKCYTCLNEKLEIVSYKGDNILNKRSELINNYRHQNKFTLLRHPFKDQKLRFHWNTSPSIPTEALVLVWVINVLHNMFSNQISSNSKRWFHWRISRWIFPVKTARKWNICYYGKLAAVTSTECSTSGANITGNRNVLKL